MTREAESDLNINDGERLITLKEVFKTMKNSDISQLRSTILKGMSISAEKLKRQKILLGRKLAVSEGGQVKTISPDQIK